eukprot:scaffold3045_cov179-Ochromonas_danica.AAC.6
MHAWSRVLILLAATVQGLKLTPVHHGMQKIDLSYESHVATTALTNALQKIEDGNLPFHDSKALLETAEIQKLHSVVRRWANMEDRLKGAIAPGSTSQLQLFEDIVHNIASIRVLIGHLLLRADDYQQAKFELELSCPALWKYKSAWRSIDSDGWLDCFASLGELYEREGDIAHLREIGQKLLQMVPPLQILLNHFSLATDAKQMSFIKKFILLGPMRRKQIASEIKRSWLALEKVRDVLQPAVDEFILFGTNRSRLSILLRVQNDIEEIIEHYLQTFKAKTDLANELTSMRVALVKQIRAEAEHYFDIMNLLIDHGEEYVLTLRSAHPLEMAHTPFEALQSAHLAEQAGVPAPAHTSPLEETLGYPRSLSSILTEFEHGIEQRKAKEEALFAAVEEKEKAAAAAAQREKERHAQRSQSYSKSKTRGSGASQSRAESRRSKPSSPGSSSANASSSAQRQRTWATWLMQLGGIVASLLGLAVLCGHYLRRSSPHSHPTHKSLTRPSRLSRPPIASRKVEAKEIPEPSEQGRVHVIKQIVLEDLHVVWVEIIRRYHLVESLVFNWIARMRHHQHDLSSMRSNNVDALTELSQHHASNGKGKVKVTGAKKKSVHVSGVDTTSIQMESNEESQPSPVQEQIPQEDNAVNKSVKRGHCRRKRHKPVNPSASSTIIPSPAQSPTLELDAAHLQEEPQISSPPVDTNLSITLSDEKVFVASVETSDGHPTIKPEKPECPSPFDGFQEEKTSAGEETIDRNENLPRPSECFNSRSSSTTTCTSSGVPFPGYSEADYLPDDYLPLDVLEQEEGWIEAPTRHNKHHQTANQSNQSKPSQLDRNAQAVLRQQAKRKEAESSFSKPHNKVLSGHKKTDKRSHALPSPSSGRNLSVDKHPPVNNPVPPSASKPIAVNSSGPSLRGYSAVVAKNLPSSSPSASGVGRQDNAVPSTAEGRVATSSTHPSTELVKTLPVLPSTNTTVADEAEISSLSDSGSPGFILPPLPMAADPQQAAAMAHYLANIQQFYYPPQVAAASGVVSPSALPTVPTMDSGLLVVQPPWLLPSPVAVGHSVFQENAGDASPTELSPPPVFFSPLGALPMTVIPSVRIESALSMSQIAPLTPLSLQMVAGAAFNREDIVDMVRKQM